MELEGAFTTSPWDSRSVFSSVSEREYTSA